MNVLTPFIFSLSVYLEANFNILKTGNFFCYYKPGDLGTWNKNHSLWVKNSKNFNKKLYHLSQVSVLRRNIFNKSFRNILFAQYCYFTFILRNIATLHSFCAILLLYIHFAQYCYFTFILRNIATLHSFCVILLLYIHFAQYCYFTWKLVFCLILIGRSLNEVNLHNNPQKKCYQFMRNLHL